MAKCRRCGKGGLFGKVDSRGFCAACAAEVAEMERRAAQQRQEDEQRRREAAQRDAEAERARREAQAAQNAEIEKEREAREKAARLAELTKPFDAPEFMRGCCLAYSYREVGFYAPDELYSAAKSVPPYKQLRLAFEPDNPFDAEAVAIYCEADKIGYMNKGKLRDMLKDFACDDEKEFLAVSRYWEDKPAFDLFFYRSARAALDLLSRRPNMKEYSLTANKNEDTQDNISLCQVGEPIDVIFDPESERYDAEVNGLFIGRFPASASKYLEKYGRFDMMVSEIDEDDETGKYSVRVMLAPDVDK